MEISAVDFLIKELHSSSVFVSKKLIKKAKEIEEQAQKNNKDWICCDDVSLEEVKDKYPAGLPIGSIYITYCSNCDQIHDVTW